MTRKVKDKYHYYYLRPSSGLLIISTFCWTSIKIETPFNVYGQPRLILWLAEYDKNSDFWPLIIRYTVRKANLLKLFPFQAAWKMFATKLVGIGMAICKYISYLDVNCSVGQVFACPFSHKICLKPANEGFITLFHLVSYFFCKSKTGLFAAATFFIGVKCCLHATFEFELIWEKLKKMSVVKNRIILSTDSSLFRQRAAAWQIKIE